MDDQRPRQHSEQPQGLVTTDAAGPRDQYRIDPEVVSLRAEVASLRAQLTQTEQQRDAFRRDFDAELDGNALLRRRLGARESETMFAFVDRLAQEHAEVRAQLTEAQQARDALTPAARNYYPMFKRAEAAEASLASLRQLPVKWRKEVATVLGFPTTIFAVTQCADELDAALAGAGPTPTQEP
jgi:chromosome segregation ATPase